MALALKKEKEKVEDSVVTVDSLIGVAEKAAENAEKSNESGITASIVYDEEKASPKEIPVKMVRIMTSANHTCSIGGVRYTFTKGVCQNVPSQVKEILRKAGLLAPI